MTNLEHLLRLVLTRVRHGGRRAPPPDDVDGVLVVLAQEYLANHRALHVLLDRDSRDTDDIPDFAPLADRQAELVGLIASTPARSGAGILVKARCARIQPPERGFDAALELSLSVADDVLRDGAPCSDPFRSSQRSCTFPAAASPEMKEQNMNNLSGADRLAIRRRNDLWRHVSNVCTTIGAFAVVALITLPANGITLTWPAIAALLATGAVGLGLSFFVLRFIDHRA